MEPATSKLLSANRATIIREAGSSLFLRRDGYPRNPKEIPLVVMLAVGVDPSLLDSRRRSIWKSGGYLVAEANSIKNAIAFIHEGDFDLILLGHHLPIEDQERLTFLIRSCGCGVPVICVTKPFSRFQIFADATIEDNPEAFLSSITEALAEIKRKPPSIARPRQS